MWRREESWTGKWTEKCKQDGVSGERQDEDVENDVWGDKEGQSEK